METGEYKSDNISKTLLLQIVKNVQLVSCQYIIKIFDNLSSKQLIQYKYKYFGSFCDCTTLYQSVSFI